MSFHSPAQLREHANADSPISHGFLQRKCDRDQHTIADGEYTDLYSSGQLFNSASIGMFAASRFGHDFSQMKLHADEASQTLPSRRTPLTVQRFPKSEDEMTAPCPTCSEAESTEASAAAEMALEEAAPAPETENAPTPATSEPTIEAPASEETPATGLIVEDSTTELGPGQMRKSEFLAQLRTEVTRAAEAAMAGTGRTTAECTYLDHWFGYYEDKNSQHIERAIRRYAPETSRATTARDYIPMVAVRVSRSVEVWARTGEITGVPEGMPLGLPGIGLLGGLGRLISGIGGIFFKAREGGASAPDNLQAIQRELGEGRPLDSGVRSRMESAFGMSFAHVRTHTDTSAAGLSNNFNARAFTVGEHVAFGANEYKPGTLIGDALIAHEMAHVVQQSGAGVPIAHMQKDADYNAVEEDADKSAMGAVASLWSGKKRMLKDITQNAIPRLRSGLSLSRCGKMVRPPEAAAIRQTAEQACSAEERQSMERLNRCCTASMLNEIQRIRARAIPIVHRAVLRLRNSPDGVRGALWDHLRIRPDDQQRIPIVRNQLELMVAALTGNNVTFSCRDEMMDPMCKAGTMPARTVPTCTGSGPFDIALCGSYESSVQLEDWPFLFGESWLKTIIHEYAHVACPGSGMILPAGQEFYKDGPGDYPPDDPDVAIKNADSYANFALDAG